MGGRPAGCAVARPGGDWHAQAVRTPLPDLAAAAICAFDAAYRPAVERALRFYDYTTPNISEFFFAAVAYEALHATWARQAD